jgi:hypothetical protein
MNDILEFISDMRELQALYNADDLRAIDFESKLFKYEKQFEQFELDAAPTEEFFQ